MDMEDEVPTECDQLVRIVPPGKITAERNARLAKSER
jgi:hypothetical protein